MKIKLAKEEEEYIENLVLAGLYKNGGDVVKDALEIHASYREKSKKDLLEEIDKGWNGPDSSKSMNDIISAKKKNKIL
ncbi:ribbon-helix-helix domain-containing protein [Zobellia barbeyronii]|uniref:Type II toxin-antitoxin system ParD family antitoxin n=1 Tax=Zobellia barbeyronii TaxID=2748009 RepID=A0ABS5WD35_9FLAO|nr:type II toxin-antitoxin system ParD family antitoxin [Zobellia barbeyronii]MBT2161312.1 type II toxin-antitoxin system ParD family antitoxin [Zobellia barbeyronii]